ncbi:MAG TPA: bacteriophage holin [Candidatus Omnitrophota bacterium]|nr:bacteriophage holin [Candidatus Omnitrophota bacterium]
MVKLEIGTFGLIFGCLWGGSVFMLGVVSTAWRGGSKVVDLFSRVYIGYKTGLTGSLIGACWAFLDGAVTGILIAWINNRFLA